MNDANFQRRSSEDKAKTWQFEKEIIIHKIPTGITVRVDTTTVCQMMITNHKQFHQSAI